MILQGFNMQHESSTFLIITYAEYFAGSHVCRVYTRIFSSAETVYNILVFHFMLSFSAFCNTPDMAMHVFLQHLSRRPG